MSADNPQLLFMQAVQLHQSGQLREAEKLYRQLLKPFPQLAPLQSNLGAVLIAQGRPEEGLRFLQKALKLDPKNVDALMNLGGLALEKQQFERAAELLTKAEKFDDKRPDISYALGNALLQHGNISEAEKAYDRALILAPNEAQIHFNRAHAKRLAGQADEALKGFQKAAQLQPQFTEAWESVGHMLADTGQAAAALVAYEKACETTGATAEAFRSKAQMLTDMGRAAEAQSVLEGVLEKDAKDAQALHLLGHTYKEQGEADKALEAYQQALTLDPENTGFQTSRARLLSRQVPGWHFTMLADRDRNDAFQAAIERAIGPDDLVLDIGTGSGLLAMMAARAGAKQVVACEMVPAIAEAARDIVAQNGYADCIQVHHKKSTDLSVGGEMPQKATVLVSEILDLGLLGEGVLPTFRHAWRELLEPGAKVIPQRAVVFAQLIAMPDRRLVNPVQNISGFDLSGFDRFRVKDDYARVDLAHENWEPLSEVFPVFDLDFAQVPSARSDNHPEISTLSTTANHAGTAQAVAFWFDLHLDEETMVSTKPDGDLKHWGQAVCFLDADREVSEGESVELKLIRSDNWLRFSW